jgi:hypothetical protein
VLPFLQCLQYLQFLHALQYLSPVHFAEIFAVVPIWAKIIKDEKVTTAARSIVFFIGYG